jgi:DNA-directed RNA polymerase specialized sigma24 family protein
MAAESEPSVSEWILGVKRGDCEAARALWERYFARLVHLARNRLSRGGPRDADEEDVALSAFASFCQAAATGRFPDLADRDDLWRLLIVLTAQKSIDLLRRAHRAKRGGGRVRGESALAHADRSESLPGLAEIVGNAPSPAFAAMVAEECDRLLGLLNDDLRSVALAKMEDYTNPEIAEKLGCSLSTVERSLRLIRKLWQSSTKA